MRRGDRLFEIIEILRRAKAPISAQSIGAELGVTKRTVYRDVAALIAQGVPINGEAGVGYVLEPGFHMPPLMLNPDIAETIGRDAPRRREWLDVRMPKFPLDDDQLNAIVEHLVQQLRHPPLLLGQGTLQHVQSATTQTWKYCTKQQRTE